jgi:hypothetical protein
MDASRLVSNLQLGQSGFGGAFCQAVSAECFLQSS